jgi:hypothetical protein
MKKVLIKDLGIELWNNFEGVFLDHNSPAFNELSDCEFSGLIKGLNIMSEEPYYSADSKECKDVREKAEKELGTKVKAVWMGKLLGFNEAIDWERSKT